MPVHERYSEFESDQRRFFDELIIEDWDAYKSMEWDYTRTFEIQQLFKRVKPPRILDIGCGVGFHDAVMAEYPFVQQVDAFDYSEQSILRANNEYPHRRVNRVVADFSSFKVQQLYDLVVSFQVFEHLKEPKRYLAFSVEACRSGGTIAICTPNRLRWDNRRFVSRKQPPTMLDVMHFREYTAEEIFALGSEFGLKSAGWFGHTLYISNSWGSSLSARWNYKQRTRIGYLFPDFAHVICVLMRKA